MNLIACILILLLAVVAGVALWLWQRERRTVEKVWFLFDAIDSGDYTFRFPIRGRHAERLLNDALNRVKQVLQNARDAQIERERFYETVLQAVDTGVLVVDAARGLVLRHNAAALRMLRRDAVTHMSQVEGALGTFSVRETEATLQGRTVRVIGFSDIKSELADRETESYVKLIRVLTHEIMNSVTPIVSLSETLLRQAEGEQRDGLQTISRTGSELMAFVENYRRFTHIPEPHPTLFYLQPFLQRMASLAGRPVEVSVCPADLILHADEGLVARVVSNLLKNAVQATPQEGNIRMQASLGEKEEVVIDVTDNGPGIPDELAQQIFVPFFTTKKEGSGIGLSISRQIMRKCGGTIALVSDAEHGLTTFRLVFP